MLASYCPQSVIKQKTINGAYLQKVFKNVIFLLGKAYQGGKIRYHEEGGSLEMH